MTRLLQRLCICLGLVASCATAVASDAEKELLDALAGTQQLQGDFIQKQFDQDDVLIQESSGHFAMLRPGYFSWDIKHPDSQLIVATPEFLWQHDRDLETVTRRPANTGIQMAPLQVLGGDEDALRSAFSIEKTPTGEFILHPATLDAGFKSLTLRIQDKQIKSMQVEDNLEQNVRIEFFSLDSATKLTAAAFAFTPPADADLFYYDE